MITLLLLGMKNGSSFLLMISPESVDGKKIIHLMYQCSALALLLSTILDVPLPLVGKFYVPNSTINTSKEIEENLAQHAFLKFKTNSKHKLISWQRYTTTNQLFNGKYLINEMSLNLTSCGENFSINDLS